MPHERSKRSDTRHKKEARGSEARKQSEPDNAGQSDRREASRNPSEAQPAPFDFREMGKHMLNQLGKDANQMRNKAANDLGAMSKEMRGITEALGGLWYQNPDVPEVRQEAPRLSEYTQARLRDERERKERKKKSKMEWGVGPSPSGSDEEE